MPSRFLSRLSGLRRKRDAPSPSELNNIEENRRYWNIYAKHWTKDDFRGFELTTESTPQTYELLGDEWGHPEHVSAILDEFIFPYIDADTVAIEIGSGGGRIASRVAPRVKHLYCLDISLEMLHQLKKAMGDRQNISLVHIESDAVLPPAVLPAEPDFVYSFDVFVHLDLHTMWKYIKQVGEVLRHGGRFFLHTSNLLAPEGWNRFASQEGFSIPGHYFVSPEIVKKLAHEAGLKVVMESSQDLSNFYKARDYLVILEK